MIGDIILLIGGTGIGKFIGDLFGLGTEPIENTNKIENLVETIENYKNQNIALKKDNKIIQIKNKNLIKALDMLNNEVNKMKKDYKEKIIFMDQQTDMLEKQTDMLEKQTMKMQILSDTLDEYKKGYEIQQNSIKNMNLDLETLRKNVHILKYQKENLQKIIDSRDIEISALKKTNAQLRQEIINLKKD